MEKDGRMRGVFGLVLVAGVALAGGAVYLAQGYISQTEQALAQEQERRAKIGELVEVYVVNKPKLYGEPLTRDDVQAVWMQAQFLPQSVFRASTAELPEEVVAQFPKGDVTLFDEGETEPRYVLRQMETFEPILAMKVTAPGEPAGLTGQLAPGMRAFAIKVDVSSGVSGFLQPGDRVDVYWTGASDTSEGNFTKLIESGVAIVAVDQLTSERSTAATIARTVTVEVNPEQVGRLAQAQATGTLALSLVGSNDEVAAGAVQVDSRDITGEVAQEIVEVQQEEVCTVSERKGAEVIVKEVECPN
jgi:pilus assembly protein CpaB